MRVSLPFKLRSRDLQANFDHLVKALGPYRPSRELWGTVSGDLSESYGSPGWTVAHITTGSYQITFTEPAGNAYHLQVTAYNSGGAAAVADVDGADADGFGVATFIANTGGGVDTYFSFYVRYD